MFNKIVKDIYTKKYSRMYSEVKQYCLNNKSLLNYASEHFKTNEKIPIINFIIKNKYY